MYVPVYTLVIEDKPLHNARRVVPKYIFAPFTYQNKPNRYEIPNSYNLNYVEPFDVIFINYRVY